MKLLTQHALNPSAVKHLGDVLDQATELDVEPNFSVTDHKLAGTAMVLNSRMLVALRNHVDYFKLPRRDSTDFCIKFAEITECTIEAKTIKSHVDWMIADGCYEQDAVFDDTEEWADLNYLLLSFTVTMLISLVADLDLLYDDGRDKLSDHLTPAFLLNRVAKAEFLKLPDLGPVKYRMFRRLVKKTRDALTGDCPLPV